MCCITEAPTFFLPQLLLGSHEMHWGLTVHLCFYFPPLAALVLLLFTSHHALAAPHSTGNLPSPQTIYSFLSTQFSSQWKPGVQGAPTGQQAARPVLVLCSPTRLGQGWGAGGTRQGEQGRASLCFWRSPKYLLNCRAFSATGHLSKAGTSFSASLGWETGRGREGTDVMHNHPSQT